jgi:type IV pilus assembly protein PilB
LSTPSLQLTDAEEQAKALAARYRLEYVDVASFSPDPEILKSVPVELMFRYNFLPYKREAAGWCW